MNETALAHLLHMPESMDMHDLLCYLRLAQEVPSPTDILILAKLRRVGPAIVTREPSRWSGYCAKPLTFAPTPCSPLADVLREDLQSHLDWEIDQQAPAGGWEPNWAWDQYSQTWPDAKMEWAGYLSVRMLWSLKQFGRIEGM
jgi:hypothetical protein